MERPETNPAGTRGPRVDARALLVGVLVAAIASRIALAGSKSLVLDEFHSYFHATNGPLSSFRDALRRDNHPPLSFLAIGASADAFGRSELALRLPALLSGLLEIALVARLVRRLGGSARAAAAGALLLAVSAMHVDYGTQARMYAPFALAVTCALSGAVELVRGGERAGRGAAAAVALGLAAAFHLHYFAVQYAVVLFAGGALACALDGAPRRALRLVGPGALTVLLCAPWAWSGLRPQLGHELQPGGDDLTVAALAESYVHLFAHNVSLAGDAARWVFVGGAGLALVLAALGALALLRSRATRPCGAVVVAAAFGAPAFSFALAQLAPRAGFTWHYVLPSAAPAAVLAAIGAFGTAGAAVRAARARSAALAAAAVTGAVLVGLHLASPATEDFRGAVAHTLERARPLAPGEDVRVVAIEWQPSLFPQGQPYDYYAPRIAGDAAPPRAEIHEGGFAPIDVGALLRADRVVLMRRSLPDTRTVVERLTARFGPPERRGFGYGLDVLEFRAGTD